MKQTERLHSNYADDLCAASRAHRRTAGRNGAAMFLLATSLIGLEARAAVVNYTDVVAQGNDIAAGLAGAAAIAADPDGTRLYVAALTDGALTILDRAAAGSLSRRDTLLDNSVGGTVDGLSGVTDVAVSPDGSHIYTVALNDHALSVFKRTTQGLAAVDIYRGIAGMQFPARIVVSPDGAQVYVATRDPAGADSVFAFTVLDADGRLGLLGRYEDGADASGIDDITGLIVSPDGRQVYASSGGDDAIALFTRNADRSSPDFGRLSWSAGYRDGTGGIDGLAGAGALALDPSGADLYVAGTGENAVAAFARNPANGGLTFLAAYRNGENGITGLGGPLALTVSPDGGHLYIAGTAQHALVVLRRDPVTGLLSFLETHRNGDDGLVDGLDHVLALAHSPDGAQLYTASPAQGKIGIFTPLSADLELTMSAEAADAGDMAYRLTVANHGPAAAGNVELTDLLPDSASVASLDIASGITCTRAADRVACDLATLAAGAAAEIVLQLDLATGTGANSAAVYADQRDPDTSDNTASDEAGANHPPVAGADSARTTPGTAITLAVLSNDSDPDGDALTVTAAAASSQHGGTITLNPDGTLHYAPAAGFRGMDTFDYTISDGLDYSSAVVSVTVNTPPVARDDAATVTADTAVEILVLSNDSDPDSDALQIGAADTASPRGGTIVNLGTSIRYTPPPGYTGSDSFAYTITDGLDTATAVVNVTVQASGKSVDAPDDDDTATHRSGGGGGLDTLCCLALLPWALGRALAARRALPVSRDAGRAAAPRR